MDENLKHLVDCVKEYNETLALRINEEIMKSESQAQFNQRILERKIDVLNGLKKNSKLLYVIWDKEAHKWLSQEHYYLNQYGEVASVFRGEKLLNQEDFEIIYLPDVRPDNLLEIMDMAGIGKLIEKQMERADILAFGKIDESRWLFKTKWIKKYHGFKDFIYKNYGKESQKRILEIQQRKLEEKIQKLDTDIEEWQRGQEKKDIKQV